MLQPQRDVLHHVLVAAAFRWLRQTVGICRRLFPNPIEVVLLLRPINCDANAEVVAVLLDEVLHGLLVVVDAVGGEAETIRVEPMVVPTIQLDFDIVAYFVDKLYLKERLAANEVPHHRLISEIGVCFMVEHIVDEGLGHLPGHPFLHVLAHKVAVFAGQLAVLGYDESDVFR